ncbi:MAG TPA: DUF620 domain-containing protein [Bryobacteraceae bacterium]|nr:DUF620 domain-containing protein [Bryobacteraceae bacterium]
MNRYYVARKIAIHSALLLAVAGVRLVAADELPKADTILDKYVEVTGGKAAYQKIHSEIQTGTLEITAMGIKGKATAWRAEPNKSYTEIELEGIGKMQDGTDGTVAWSLSAMQGPHVKEGAEKSMAMIQAKFQSEVNWRDIYKKVETTGAETVDGKECYKLVLTPNEGSPITQYFDKQSNLMVKMTMTAQSPMGEIEVESYASDYRKEGDLLMPHKMRQSAAGQEFTMTVESVQYNPDIPKNRFDLPDEIKALVSKK